MKTPSVIRLNCSEPELAKFLSDSEPPTGITVSKPNVFIQASAPAQMFWQVIISIAPGIPSGLIVAFILHCLDKSGKKSARINREEVILDKRGVVRLIHKELAKQDARDAQRRKDKKQPGKQRS